MKYTTPKRLKTMRIAGYNINSDVNLIVSVMSKYFTLFTKTESYLFLKEILTYALLL